MFELEKSIAAWRKQMLAAGIKSPVPMDELESHLREEVERQTKLGLNAQQAFETAASNVGHASELKREFKKIVVPMDVEKVTKLAGIICVALALAGQLLCAPTAFHVALAYGPRLSFIARMLPLAGLAATLALILSSWKYNDKLLPAIPNQLHRRAIGLACYAACLLWIRFVLFHVGIGHIENIISRITLINFLFGAEWAVIAILGGVAYGLEKAVHRQNTQANP